MFGGRSSLAIGITRKRSGLSMLEVLVATGILSIAIVFAVRTSRVYRQQLVTVRANETVFQVERDIRLEVFNSVKTFFIQLATSVKNPCDMRFTSFVNAVYITFPSGLTLSPITRRSKNQLLKGISNWVQKDQMTAILNRCLTAVDTTRKPNYFNGPLIPPPVGPPAGLYFCASLNFTNPLTTPTTAYGTGSFLSMQPIVVEFFYTNVDPMGTGPATPELQCPALGAKFTNPQAPVMGVMFYSIYWTPQMGNNPHEGEYVHSYNGYIGMGANQ